MQANTLGLLSELLTNINMDQQSLLDTFDHVVVLMLENRSFDNILGYLYENDVPSGKTFTGVAGDNLIGDVRRHHHHRSTRQETRRRSLKKPRSFVTAGPLRFY